MNVEEFRKKIEEFFPFARCFGSKSLYRRKFPEHLVIFNARIYSKESWERVKDMDHVNFFFEGRKEEMWYGDLDLTLDLDTLRKLRTQFDFDLYISTEHGSLVCRILENEVIFEDLWSEAWERKKKSGTE